MHLLPLELLAVEWSGGYGSTSSSTHSTAPGRQYPSLSENASGRSPNDRCFALTIGWTRLLCSDASSLSSWGNLRSFLIISIESAAPVTRSGAAFASNERRQCVQFTLVLSPFSLVVEHYQDNENDGETSDDSYSHPFSRPRVIQSCTSQSDDPGRDYRPS
jgi:hypothetical protein